MKTQDSLQKLFGSGYGEQAEFLKDQRRQQDLDLTKQTSLFY